MTMQALACLKRQLAFFNVKDILNFQFLLISGNSELVVCFLHMKFSCTSGSVAYDICKGCGTPWRHGLGCC